MSSSKGTVLVTGTNGGLGSAIVADILKKPEIANNYTGLYTVRKAATAEKLNKVLEKAPQTHEHQVFDLDLSSIAKVREGAASINAKVASGELPPIRSLILNAAWQDHADIHMSDDGFEMTWHVNFLANFIMALMLVQSMDKQEGRILILGSWSHDIEDDRNRMGGQKSYNGYDSLFPGPEPLAKGTWSAPDSGEGAGFRRYGASKLCAVMLMHELAVRLGKDPELSGITVYGLDPGAMASDLTRRGPAGIKFMIKNIAPVVATLTSFVNPNGAFRTMVKSAGDAAALCWEVEKSPKGTATYRDGTQPLVTSKEARDEVKRKALWEYGLKVAGLTGSDTVLNDWQ